MDDNTIIQLITSSQLDDQDKNHWISLLPKLSDDQKQQLSDILTVKAKVRHAIAEIDHALATIEEAEKGVDSSEDPIPNPVNPTVEDLTNKYDSVVKAAPQKVDLEKMKLAEEQKLADLRSQLNTLSISSQNTPPSGNN